MISKVKCSYVKVEGHFRFGKTPDKVKNVRVQWVVAPPTGMSADAATATATSKEKEESAPLRNSTKQTWIILEWTNEKISTSKQEIQDVVDVSVDAIYVPR